MFEYYGSLSLSVYLIIFYCVVAYVVFIFAIVLYIYVQQKRKKQGGWINTVFATITLCDIYILHIPIMGTFLSILSCKDNNLSINPELKCFSTDHIIHFIIGIIFAILFFIWQQISTALFFESSWNSKNALARKWSPFICIEICIQTLILIIETFIDERSIKLWIIGIVFTVTYALILKSFIKESLFINENMNIAYLLYSCANLWSGLVLLISEIMLFTKFNAGLIILIIGLIFIILYVIYWPINMNLSTLTKSPIEYQTPEESTRSLKETLKLLESKGISEYKYLTNGLLLHHTLKCHREDCPLSSIKGLYEIETQTNTKRKNQQKIKEKCDWAIIFLNYINWQFYLCIAKFPNDISLRLFYVLFLVEHLRNTSMANDELSICASKNPGFIHQFLIHCYTELIKDHIIISGKMQNQSFNVAAAMAYETQYKRFREKIDRATVSHIQFWSILWEESPNLQKLTETGFKILNTLETIELIWNNLQQMSFNNPKTTSIYANFCENVTHDEELSKNLKTKARDLIFNKSQAMHHNFDGFSINSVSKDGSPCVIVSSGTNSIGNITECNLAMCRLFGYQKRDLIGKSINRLMPQMYAQHHSAILQESLESKEQISQGNSIVIKGFGLESTGYVFNMEIRILGLPSYNNNFTFVAIFTIDKSYSDSNIGFVLMDMKFTVQYISTSCLNLLNINKMLLQNEEISAIDLFPDLFSLGKISKKFKEKAKNIIVYQGHKTGDTTGSDISGKEQKIEFECEIEEIKMKKYGIIGYYIKLELLSQIINNDEKSPADSINRRIPQPPFQFKYDENLNKYLMIHDFTLPLAYCDSLKQSKSSKNMGVDSPNSWNSYYKTPPELNHLYSERHTGAFNKTMTNSKDFGGFLNEIQKNSSGFFAALIPKITNMLKIADANFKIDTHSIERDLGAYFTDRNLNIGKGITTYRLIKGEYVELSSELSQSGLFLPDVSSSIFDDAEGQNRRDISSTSQISEIKSKESFRLRLLEAGQPTELTILFIISLLISAAIISFSIVQYYFTTVYLAYIQTALTGVHESNQMILLVHDALFITRELVFINEDLTDYYEFKNITKEEYLYELKSDLKNLVDILNDQLDVLVEGKENLANPKDFDDIYLAPNVDISDLIHGNIISFKYTFVETILEFVSNLFVVAGLSQSEYNSDNFHIHSVIFNGYNSIDDAVQAFGSKYDSEVFKEEERNMGSILGFFITSIVVSVCFLPIVLVFVRIIHKNKEKILRLFLEIPGLTVKQLNNSCETFLNQLRNDNFEEENDSLAGDYLERNKSDLIESEYASRRKRAFSNKPHFIQKFSIMIILTILILCGYFTANYVLETNYRTSHKSMVKDFEGISEIVWISITALNLQRECFYDQKNFIIDNITPCEKALELLNIAYENTKLLETVNIQPKLIDQATSDYLAKLLKGNLCENTFGLEYNSSYINCETFREGVLKQGLSLLISYYFEMLRQSLTEYNEKAKNKYQILTGDNLETARTIQTEFLNGFIDIFVTEWKNGTRDEGQLMKTIRLSILIAFIFVLIFALIFFWRPFLNYLKETVFFSFTISQNR